MNNGIFKEKYKKYENQNKINISDENFSRYRETKTKDVFPAVFIIFLSTFFLAFLIFKPYAYVDTQHPFPAFLGGILVILSATLASVLLSKPLTKISTYFLSSNIKLERAIDKYVYTGELECIFNINNKVVSDILKEEKQLLLNDIRDSQGIKGSTILKIFHKIQLEKIKILNTQIYIEYELLELSPETIEKINYIQKISAKAEIDYIERKIIQEQEELKYTSKKLTESERKNDDHSNISIKIENDIKNINSRIQYLDRLKIAQKNNVESV